MSKKNVVILGSGVSGHMAAQALAKNKQVQVTVVTGCSFVEWPLVMTHVFVNPDDHAKALAPNTSQYEVPGVTYKYATVEKIDPAAKKVICKDASVDITYDILIVATGFGMPLIYPTPGQTLQDRKAQVKDIGEKIKHANTILVGGGGPVALEFAGDIKCKYPTKKVKIAAKDMLKAWPEEQSKAAASQARAMGIEVVKITANAPMEPSLSAGSITIDSQTLDYDLYFPMFSQGPNTSFLADSGILDAKNRVQLNDYLQSEKYPEIFAIGTGTAADNWVGLATLEPQKDIVVANVQATLASKPLKKHKPSPMTRQPVLLIGHGPNGYGLVDFSMAPGPLKFCCCGGYGGFPCCPPPCCWPMCGPCAVGYCCAGPSGPGFSNFAGKMMFKFGGSKYKGMGAPEQQTMS
mmetsp:Transcript_66029/g.123141  ORF Transcript_66029/g.123141 Transcript_66029/m.123141 type:complete len:407 (-) Transcript_66029:148-1368(-)